MHSSRHTLADNDLIGEEQLHVPNDGDLHRTISKTSTTAAEYGSSDEDEERKRKNAEKRKEPFCILGTPYVRLRDDGAQAYK